MERLINAEDVKKILVARYEGAEYIEKDIDRLPTVSIDLHELNSYKDTGLTPEEIGAIRLDNKFLQKQNKEFREEILKARKEWDYWEREAKKWCDKGFKKEIKHHKIEKEYKWSTLFSKNKKDLVEQIMCLVHNNNVLHDTVNQQVENFKTMLRDAYNNLDKKSFKVDLGHNQTDTVRLVDIEEELLNKI